MVVHTCNSSHSGGRDQEDSSLGKELARPYLNTEASHVYLLPQLCERHRSRDHGPRLALGKKVRYHQKIANAKS
jgi:hypothetical protein